MSVPISVKFPSDFNEMFERVRAGSFGQTRFNEFDDFLSFPRSKFDRMSPFDTNAQRPTGVDQMQAYQPFQGRCPQNERDTNTQRQMAVVPQDEGFSTSLDVHEYKPHELSVRVIDNVVVIEGKSEQGAKEKGFTSRNFIRKYTVPPNCDIERTASSLSADGKLSVRIPIRQTRMNSLQNTETTPPQALPKLC